MGMVPETAGRDARLRADRRPAHGRLRRLLGRRARRPPDDMGCEVLITQDEAWRRGATVPLKRTADEAIAAAPSVRAAVVLRRTGGEVPMTPGRDHWWHELATDDGALPVRADGRRGSALPPLHLGHDREAEGDRPHDRRLPRRRRDHPPLRLRRQARLDVYWCAADVGWVTGHSYIVYGPLCNGTTVGPLRGDARLPRQGPLVGDRRALRGRRSSTPRRPRSAPT